MATVDQIISGAQIEADRTISEAVSVILRDIDRVTVGRWADPAITPAWQRMSLDERSRLARTELLWAHRADADDRYKDAIPRAIRAIVRCLTIKRD